MGAGVEQAGRGANEVVVAVTGEQGDPVGVDRVVWHPAAGQALADLAVAPLARQQGRQRHRQVPLAGRRHQVGRVPAGSGQRAGKRGGGPAEPGEEAKVGRDLHLRDLAEEAGQQGL
jgi:hypothetical protein